MQRLRPHRVLIVALVVLSGSVLFGIVAPAQAEGLGLRGWGVRGGLSSEPDQFVLGMHANMGEFAQNLRFTPNADIGFGDHLTVFTLNPDIVYALPLPEAGRIYFGGTLSFVYVKLDLPKLESAFGNVDDTDTDIGVAGVIGYEPPTESLPIFFDLKVGISDEYPDLKIMVGYNFNRD
jgi:hypothetical protein